MAEIDDIRRRLTVSASEASRARESAEMIASAARERRDTIQKRIGELRPLALASADADSEYRALMAERGRLDLILGVSRTQGS